MRDFFTAVGATVIIAIVVTMIWGLVYTVREFIRERIWIYRYNHRFDKPPTAKCYCKDCSFYGDFEHTRLCKMHNRSFADDYFCKDADPCKAESGLAREKAREKGEDE